jgi:hypothetical protein
VKNEVPWFIKNLNTIGFPSNIFYFNLTFPASRPFFLPSILGNNRIEFTDSFQTGAQYTTNQFTKK